MSREPVAVLCVLLLLGCGGESEPAEAPPQPSGATEPEAPEVEPEVEPDAEVEVVAPEPEPSATGPQEVQVVALPAEGRIRLSGFGSRQAEVDRLSYDADPDEGDWASKARVPRVRGDHDALNAFIVSVAQAALPSYLNEVGCSPGLLRDDVVSMICGGGEYQTRGEATIVETVVTREPQGSGANLPVAAMVLPTFDWATRLRATCRAELEAGDGYTCDEYQGWGSHLSLGRRGIIAWVEHQYYQPRDESLVPFRELDRQILADSLLGRLLLAEVEGTSTVTVTLPAHVSVGQPVEGQAVSDVLSVHSALARWLLLPEGSRGSVVVAGAGRERRLVVAPGAGDAAAIAALLGTEPVPHQWQHAGVPFVARAKTDLVLRSSPGGQQRYSMPEGTFGVALLQEGSATGRRGTWARFSTSSGFGGWAAGNLLEPHEGCLPDASTFLSEVPERRRGTAEATLLRAFVDVRRGSRIPAVAFLAATRGRTQARGPGASRLAIYRRGDGCAVGSRLMRLDVPGLIEGLRVVTTRPHGGKTLVIVDVLTPERRALTMVHRLGEDESIWEGARVYPRELSFAVRDSGDYFPIVVSAHGGPGAEPEVLERYRWDDEVGEGGGLVLVTE